MLGLHQFKNIRCRNCDHAATFHLVHAAPNQEKNPYPSNGREWMDSKTSFGGLFKCENCQAPTYIEFEFKQLAATNHVEAHGRSRFLNRIEPLPAEKGKGPGGFIVRGNARPTDLGQICTVVTTFPSVLIAVPEHLPPQIEQRWADDLAQVMGRSPRMTVVACRTVIEQMCKDKQATGKNIAAKIDSLVTMGVLAKDVGEWAHTIRVFGNDAVHDEDAVSAVTAREIYDFTRVIAELIYTYPARIRLLRASPEPGDESENN